MKKILEGGISGALESNEVPYIVPRIVLGSIVLYIISLCMLSTADLSSTLPELSLLNALVVIFIAWFLGYIIDCLSSVLCKRAVGVANKDGRFFYQTLAGYRFMLMTSLMFSGMLCLAILLFSLFLDPAYHDADAPFPLLLISFLSFIAVLAGLFYIYTQKNHLSDEYLSFLTLQREDANKSRSSQQK